MSLFLENLSLAFSAIWANKARAFLTILGVVIGVFAVIMIVAITAGLKDEIVGMVASLGSDVLDIMPSDIGEGEGFNMGSSPALNSFSEKEAKEFKEKTKNMLPLQSRLYQLGGKFQYQGIQVKGFVMGAEPDYFAIRRKEPIEGTLFNESDERSKAKVAVLGLAAAEELFGSAKRAIGKEIKVNSKEVKVVGVLEKEELGFVGFDMNKSVYLPSSTTANLFEEARIMEIFVKAENEAKVPETKRALEKIMSEIRPDGEYSIFTQETIMQLVNKITGLITSALAGLASISLLVGGIGIMNIMLVSVTERTREIGIRKAVGATNTNILTQFLIEAVALCLTGGLVGFVIASGVSVLLTRYVGFPTLISWQTVVGSFSFSVLVGVVFGIVPAFRAAHKDPIEALRYE